MAQAPREDEDLPGAPPVILLGHDL